MSAEAVVHYHDPELATRRLLTEAEHFIKHMDVFGNVPENVFNAVVQNRMTAVAEIAMPYAVTETEHEVIDRASESGRRERVIMWLGKTALEVAASGYKYHFSQAAHTRVAVEESEAIYAQETLRPGIVQVLISPKMTTHDAPKEVAKAEHLYADDAIRVSTATTNENGKVIGRKLSSLLVRDIPFMAWVKMLKDPGSIFGKVFDLRDELSAVSVMELFSQMDLPEHLLPEGPVTLVEAVLPYVDDELAQQKIKRQLKRFRGDQKMYAHESKVAGREWAKFDLELARSIQEERATEPLRFFIMQNAHVWNDKSLEVITRHALGDTQYHMTHEFAALLAQAKQKLMGDEISVVSQNDKAIANVSMAAAQEIRQVHAELLVAQTANADPAYIYSLQQRQYRLLHQQDIQSGGGCAGTAVNAFKRGNSTDSGQQFETGVGENDNPFESNAEDKSSWKWKQGVCQVKTCPSPKPTEVGPCSVCRRCQYEFDAGRDPTKVASIRRSSTRQVGTVSLLAARTKRSKKAGLSAKFPIAA